MAHWKWKLWLIGWKQGLSFNYLTLEKLSWVCYFLKDLERNESVCRYRIMKAILCSETWANFKTAHHCLETIAPTAWTSTSRSQRSTCIWKPKRLKKVKYHLKHSDMHSSLSFLTNLGVAMTNRKFQRSSCSPTGNQFTPNQKNTQF